MKTEYQPFNKFDIAQFTLCEAAPDLMAALERIVKFYEAHGACEVSMCEQAKAAIAKAKGDN